MTKSRPTVPRGLPGATKSRAMLRDIFEAKRDLSGLCEHYDLSPEQLAVWADDAERRKMLQGLCVLADLQTQLMLSRYRQLAVGELIRQATGGEEGVTPEQARRACVDLLRADLKLPSATRADSNATIGGVAEHEDLHALRDAIFGDKESSDDVVHGLERDAPNPSETR
ncbi:MAG: hypothetical protein AAGH92_10215 [Planctomycetota bacterium]